ncbi:unnamed protein product [Rangifer tarandus platyrhynchus]|uniref:Uncharacterized protein n=2 Tax=Rangifer tarandus platyrhynchus TaxID=3082113 RepID=A0ACB0EVA2_RANTA|nr:unnamed protein product [Rangifer tarandus platyrhynchus]CAI9703926.1 unnamed protein product [Rangifer tarandus platyrhynchus]
MGGMRAVQRTAYIMGCVHAPRKGLSHLALSHHHSVSTWLKLTSEDTKEQTYKLVEKSLTPSRIGLVLRDSRAVTQYILGQAVKS